MGRFEALASWDRVDVLSSLSCVDLPRRNSRVLLLGALRGVKVAEFWGRSGIFRSLFDCIADALALKLTLAPGLADLSRAELQLNAA